MASYNIPIAQNGNQEFDVKLGDSMFLIRIFVSDDYVIYADITVNGNVVASGIKCVNNYNLLKFFGEKYGNLYMKDTVGNLDPLYDGLGTRYKLYWDSI